MKKLHNLWKAWRFHRRAEAAADQLRFHTNKELRDIGITRADIKRMAHHKCPWCKGKQ